MAIGELPVEPGNGLSIPGQSWLRLASIGRRKRKSQDVLRKGPKALCSREGMWTTRMMDR